MANHAEILAQRYPDNTLIKRLPPQGFYSSFLDILLAPVTSGARETLQWLTALCYMKKPLKSPSRGHFEGELRELTGIADKTFRDHAAELVKAGLLQCYRTSRHEFMLYPLTIVAPPEGQELAQLTLLDVGEPKAKSHNRRKSAESFGGNPPKPEGQVGRSASLKPTYLPNSLTTAENLTVKVGGNPPKVRRKSAETATSAPTFGENPPKVKREKEPAAPRKKADTSNLSTEALVIFEQLELLGFWDDPIVVIARNAAEQGYTADEVVARAQTIIEEVSTEEGINDVMNVAKHRLAKFVILPKRKLTKKQARESETRQRFRAEMEAQKAETAHYYATTTPTERLLDRLLELRPDHRAELIKELFPDERELWEAIPPQRRDAFLIAPQTLNRRTG